MPSLTVEGVGSFDVPAGTRLVLGLTDFAKQDQMHACGGVGKCTTCRVEFTSGEPAAMTEAEKAVLGTKGLTGVRLSCQIAVEADMGVRVVSRLADTTRADAGKRPTEAIQPTPVWAS